MGWILQFSLRHPKAASVAGGVALLLLVGGFFSVKEAWAVRQAEARLERALEERDRIHAASVEIQKKADDAIQEANRNAEIQRLKKEKALQQSHRASLAREAAESRFLALPPGSTDGQRLTISLEMVEGFRTENKALVEAVISSQRETSYCKIGLRECEEARAGLDLLLQDTNTQLFEELKKPKRRRRMWDCGPGVGVGIYPDLNASVGIYCVFPIRNFLKM